MTNKTKPNTPVTMSAPDLTSIERDAVAAVLQTPNLSMGKQILAFEDAIGNYTGSRHAIGVSSGTAGLHLCIRAAGVQDGDFVITTPFSFVSSANVILFERAVPVFVDVDPVTGNIHPTLLHKAIKDLFSGENHARKWLPRKGWQQYRTPKAIIPVDVFGQPADMDPINTLAKQYQLTVIEDSCEALGAQYKGKPAGTLGDMGVFAFYPNKQITTGEGGMVVTGNDDYAQTIRSLRNQGRAPGDTWLAHTLLGYNYRLDEMSAALGAAQMTRIEELLGKRERVANWYLERLSEVNGIDIPQIVSNTTRMSWFVFVIRIKPEHDRDSIAAALKQRGIPVRPYFLPIHLQPYMQEKFGYQNGDFPVTEALGKQGLALPFSGIMTENQVDFVCQSIDELLG